MMLRCRNRGRCKHAGKPMCSICPENELALRPDKTTYYKARCP